MWQRIKRWWSGAPHRGSAESSGPAEAHDSPDAAAVLVTLRQLEIAQKFPLELPDDAVGLDADAAHTCRSCGGSLARVIITTGGPFGDDAVWEAYPLALDGWRCAGCQNLTYPVTLSPAEITELLQRSTAAAQRGDFDDAELGFRRATASWPTYMPARANFGSMCLDRARAEQAAAQCASVIERYAQLAEVQLRKALVCEPPAPVKVRFMLGKLLVRRGRRAEGAELLREAVRSPQLPGPLREEAESILAEAPA